MNLIFLNVFLVNVLNSDINVTNTLNTVVKPVLSVGVRDFALFIFSKLKQTC